MNISDKQLTALMMWVRSYTILEHYHSEMTREQEDRCRRALCDAFGFACGPGIFGGPLVPQTSGPTTEHRQADADYDNKHEAFCKVLTDDGFFHVDQVAKDLMRLWPELKAIMEPDA